MSMQGSNSYTPQSNTEPLIPKKEEWALINQFKAIQFERMKQMQKMMDYEKKRKLKQQLHHQMQGKSGIHQVQKEADQKYYEYIVKKSEQMKQREQRQKINKIMKRKQVEQQNQYFLDQIKNSRGKDRDHGYHLDIGIKSQLERRNMQEFHKRQMLDTLDMQLKIKAEEKKRERMKSLETDEANLRYQYDKFDQRNYQNRKFGQNQNVYMYYKNLEEEKKIREKQLEHKIVEEAAIKKKEEEDYKIYIKQKEKSLLTNQMKNTLDLQIDIHNRKSEQEKQVNPEQHTYSVLGKMFQEKQSPYNKREYSEYLKRQADNDKQRRKHDKFMSQQQYRINMNQLNRAISGAYAHQKYIDRSISSIGENKKVNLTQINDKVNDQDRQVVKMKLDNIKSRNKYFNGNESYIY